MAATVDIRRVTGASPGADTTITSINTRANAYDTHSTADTTNPIKIPTAGSNYSYWVTTRLDAISSPTGTIDNIKWYTDSSDDFGTGVTTIAAKASTSTDEGYRIATGTPGETGTELSQGNHNGLDEAVTDPFAFTTGSPKSLVGTISNPTTGKFGDHWVYQLVIGTGAGPGATNQETFTWRYDET